MSPAERQEMRNRFLERHNKMHEDCCSRGGEAPMHARRLSPEEREQLREQIREANREMRHGHRPGGRGRD